MDLHDPASCPTCQSFRQRILERDPGLTCIHGEDRCELCLTTEAERA